MKPKVRNSTVHEVEKIMIHCPINLLAFNMNIPTILEKIQTDKR